MILTVTPNTGIDRTLVVPKFNWNETIRVQELAVGMGGKATDSSWVLGELGIENMAMGFAAGHSGQLMEHMLRAKGVQCNFTWVEGETRINTIVVSSAGEGQSTLTANSLVVRPEHVAEFERAYASALDRAGCVIIGGSLPPGTPLDLYPRMVRLARAKNIPVVFDASGAELRAGLEGLPTLIKPNRDELEDLLYVRIHTVEDAYQAACQLNAQYGCTVIATLGAKGALAVTGDAAFFIDPVVVEVRSAAGAGDAILAGLAHALAAGLPMEEGLRLGFAAASAVLMTLPTADCRRADVQNLLPCIRIREYAPGSEA